MIYMISVKSNPRLKIGYTKDINERLNSYWTPLADMLQVIDVIEGTKEDEKNYQLTLESMGFKKVSDERGTEWFIIPSAISKKVILEKGFKIFNE